MLFHKFSDIRVPCQSRPDYRVVVQSHRHTVTGAAERDSALHLAILYSTGQFVREVAVIATLLAVGAVIYDLKPAFLKLSYELGLVLKSCVIAANAYSLHNR